MLFCKMRNVLLSALAALVSVAGLKIYLTALSMSLSMSDVYKSANKNLDVLLNQVLGGNNDDDNNDSSNNISISISISAITNDELDFSACLLIMDDNHRLPEWIAFHFFTLNLRYLIVAVDPYSITSPKTILDTWRRQANMTIIQWTDSDFTSQNLTRLPTATYHQNRPLHKARQMQFYTQCTKHLKQNGRKWTAYIDSDEYVSVNQALLPEAPQLMQQPGAVAQLFYDLRHDTQHALPNSSFYQQNMTCYTIPRRRYTAKESTDEEIYQVDLIPPGFNASFFETLNFRYLQEAPTVRNGYCKAFIDVSQVDDKYLKWNTVHGSPHRPFRPLCTSQYVNYEYPIGIHHYMGSAESYLYRNDSRTETVRNLEYWSKTALLDKGGTDDELRGWLQGFVTMVGPEHAQRLLHGTGVLDYSWRQTNHRGGNTKKTGIE